MSVLVRLGGIVIDSIEAGLLDYVLDSSFCDELRAGDLALLEFCRLSVYVDLCITYQIPEPFLWYRYTAGTSSRSRLV